MRLCRLWRGERHPHIHSAKSLRRSTNNRAGNEQALKQSSGDPCYYQPLSLGRRNGQLSDAPKLSQGAGSLSPGTVLERKGETCPPKTCSSSSALVRQQRWGREGLPWKPSAPRPEHGHRAGPAVPASPHDPVAASPARRLFLAVQSVSSRCYTFIN